MDPRVCLWTPGKVYGPQGRFMDPREGYPRVGSPGKVYGPRGRFMDRQSSTILPGQNVDNHYF